MNRTLGAELIAYSVWLVLLALLDRWVTAGQIRVTAITGIAGAVVFAGLGVTALAGARSRTLPIIALVIMSLVLLWQVIYVQWPTMNAEDGSAKSAVVPAIIMLFLSAGMLILIACARPGGMRGSKGGEVANPDGKPRTPQRM